MWSVRDLAADFIGTAVALTLLLVLELRGSDRAVRMLQHLPESRERV